MLAGQDLVASLNDQLMALIVKPFAIVVGDGSGFLQGGIGRDHFAGNQVPPDAEMFRRQLPSSFALRGASLRIMSFVGDCWIAVHSSCPMRILSIPFRPSQSQPVDRVH
jgi:hypothetical protein